MRQLHWIIFILLFGLFSFLFIDTLDYTFTYREQSHLFLFDRTFFDGFIYEIGGLGRYISVFIIQFFYIPYVGEAIFALILSLIYLLATLASRRITKANDTLFFALIPAIYLLIQYESIGFDIHHATNLAIVLLFSYALSYLKGARVVIIGTFLAILFSYLFGWIYILVSIATIGLSCLSSRLLKPSKQILSTVIILVIYISVSTTLFVKNYNLKSKLLAVTEISLQKGDWQQTLDYAKMYGAKNQLMCYYQNIALAKSGKLTTDLFKYDQKEGAKSLFFLLDNNAAQYSKVGHYVYEHIGHINEAAHWANESIVVYGETAPNLINLIRYNLLLDKPKIAMRYLKRLEKSLFYQNEVSFYKDLIEKGEKPNTYISIENNNYERFTNTLNFQAEIESSLISNPNNKAAAIYYLSFLLLDKQVNKFATELIKQYDRNNIKESEISKTYLEAIFIHAQYDNESTFTHLLTPEIEQQHIEYATLKRQKQWGLLKSKYSTSYWFYLDYSDNI